MKNYSFLSFRTLTVLVIAASFCSSAFFLTNETPSQAANRKFGGISATAQPSKIIFEENRGQFDERAKFVSRGGGLTTFLAPTEVVYVMPLPAEEVKSKADSRDGELNKHRNSEPAASRAFALRMQFVNANRAPQIKGIEQSEKRTNYFRGNDASRWLTDIPNFARVRYEDVYAGIDLEFYGNARNQNQYDFKVAAGVDPSQIELDFDGADAVKIDAQTGELLVETAAGTLRQTKPFSYQTTDAASGAKTEIESGFEIAGATRVRFRVGSYDASKPLVIDPALNNLAYSTYLGGAERDQANDLKTDAMGNVYAAGFTESDFFPTTAGTFDTTYNGSTDVFVTKTSADGGRLIYSTYLGGNVYDECKAIAVDSAGSVYLTGLSDGGFPTTAGAFDQTPNGFGDVFVAKLNANGNGLIYSTYLGGGFDEWGRGLSIDAGGNAYIAGNTGSSNFPTTSGAFDTTFNQGDDVFVSKLNAGGTALVYSTFLGSFNNEIAYGLAVDNSGNAVIGGFAESGFPTTVGAYDTTFDGGNTDAFVSKINAGGTALVFSTYLGGSSFDNINGIALDSLANVYVTGRTTALGMTPFPTTAGAYDETANGNSDAFVTKFNPAGSSLVYSTFLGGSDTDQAFDIAVDSSGAAYITGEAYSSNFPTTPNCFDATYNGSSDAFVTKLNAAGSALNYSTFFGGSNIEAGKALSLDSARNIYLAGYAGNTLPTTPNAFQTEWAGSDDAFVAKFGNFAIAGRALDVAGAAVPNATIALSGATSGTRTTDAAGNFSFLDAFPNEAYTVSASKSGTIFNPSLFNIADLNNNRHLIFVAGGAPSGGGAGGNLFLSAGAYSVNESDNAATVRVWRDLATINNAVSVNYATGGGTATAGLDYSPASGTLTFAPGETEKTFTVAIADDVAVEGAETINLALSNPTGGATLGTSAAVLSIFDNGEARLQSSGYDLSIVASGGVLKGRHLAGIAASPIDGTLYVAADNNFIEPPTGLTNNCGTQPAQTGFDLFRIAPNGTTSLLGNYQIPHRALVNLEFDASDGQLYTVGSDRQVYRINATSGALSIFNSDVGFDTTRYGLESNAAGNLILMRYGAPNSFYRVSAGSGAIFLGSYPDDAASNFGDRFGIQPDGDYIVYSDAPAARNPRDFEIDTTGHADGTPYNFTYLSTSNVRALGSPYLISNGAVDPSNGDVFTAGGNCAAGSSVILRTPNVAAVAPAASSIFIGGAGNDSVDGVDNFNARGVTDLDFGARRDGANGVCLYFSDDYNDVVYQSCRVAPTAANVSVGGRVADANGSGLARAEITMTDSGGAQRTVFTNSFGYFNFTGVPVGETYVFTVRAKGWTFAAPSQVRSVGEALTDIDFTADNN